MLAVIASTIALIVSLVFLLKKKTAAKIAISALLFMAVLASWSYWFIPVRIDIPSTADVKMDIRLTNGNTVNLDRKQVEDLVGLLKTIELRHTTDVMPIIFADQTQILSIDGSGLTRKGPIHIYLQNGETLDGFVDFGGSNHSLAKNDMIRLNVALDELQLIR